MRRNRHNNFFKSHSSIGAIEDRKMLFWQVLTRVKNPATVVKYRRKTRAIHGSDPTAKAKHDQRKECNLGLFYRR